MLDETGQVFDVNGGQGIVARVDHWKRSQVWMQREPCSPEELIEDIVGLTMAVGQTTADHANLDVLVELSRGHGQILQVLDHLEAWVGHSSGELIISQLGLTILTWSVSPDEDGGDDDERLLLRLVLV